MTSQKAAEIKDLIETLTANLPGAIEASAKYNQSIEIISSPFSEMISAACYDTKCAGTGGGGWDHLDHGEDKCTSRVQSRKCESCGKKVSFFVTSCPHCDSTSLSEIPKDSRWGINSKSHFEYQDKLKEYRLLLIEPMQDDPSCRAFRLRHWVIDPKSKHLTEYARAQCEKSSKSNHINFQPLKQDFYLSAPVLRFDAILDATGQKTQLKWNFFDLENNTPEEIPDKYKGKTTKQILASKKFGKERGQWNRN